MIVKTNVHWMFWFSQLYFSFQHHGVGHMGWANESLDYT